MVSYSSKMLPRQSLKVVLILIVVEDGLVLRVMKSISVNLRGLNPYCSGRWSRTDATTDLDKMKLVLILIVVEDGLVPDGSTGVTNGDRFVLILIVVEDGLVLTKRDAYRTDITVLILIVVEDGLVLLVALGALLVTIVLILIVVEDGLVLLIMRIFMIILMIVLILIVVEDGLVHNHINRSDLA